MWISLYIRGESRLLIPDVTNYALTRKTSGINDPAARKLTLQPFLIRKNQNSQITSLPTSLAKEAKNHQIKDRWRSFNPSGLYVPEYASAGLALEAIELISQLLVALPLDHPATRRIHFSSPGSSLSTDSGSATFS